MPLRFSVFIAVVLSGCVSTQPLPPEWRDVPHAPRIRAVQLDADGNVALAPRPLRPINVRVEGNRIMRGETALTPPFEAIDSFDVSESRGEIAFSAKRNGNFDIGLVSTDGSPISWVPSDPADEVAVQWAPRGNKISFVVRSKGGDFLRTVHIPTAAQLLVDFPGAKIEALGWDPKGERFAVAYSTPDASDRVEVMTYEGNDRKIVKPPAEQLDVDVTVFAPEAISLRPRDMQYNEKLPLVVWVDDEPYAWSDARVELMRNARVACIVTRRNSDQIWSTAKATPWIDASKTFLVDATTRVPGDSTLITADMTLPPNRFRRTGSTVAVPPAVVPSFAARFIAGQLKGTNGSSR